MTFQLGPLIVLIKLYLSNILERYHLLATRTPTEKERKKNRPILCCCVYCEESDKDGSLISRS